MEDDVTSIDTHRTSRRIVSATRQQTRQERVTLRYESCAVVAEGFHEHVNRIVGVAANGIRRKAIKSHEHLAAGIHGQRRPKGTVVRWRAAAVGTDTCRLARIEIRHVRAEILHEHVAVVVGVAADQVRRIAHKCHEHVTAGIHEQRWRIGREISLRPISVGTDTRDLARGQVLHEHIGGEVGVSADEVRSIAPKSNEQLAAGIHGQRRRKGIAVRLRAIAIGTDSRGLTRGEILHEHVVAVVGIAADEVRRHALKSDEHMAARIHGDRWVIGVTIALRPTAVGADMRGLTRGEILHKHVIAVVGIAADEVRRIAIKSDEDVAAGIHGQRRRKGIAVRLRAVAIGADTPGLTRGEILHENVIAVVRIAADEVRRAARKRHEHSAVAIHGQRRRIGRFVSLRPSAVGADKRRDPRQKIPQQHVQGIVGVAGY